MRADIGRAAIKAQPAQDKSPKPDLGTSGGDRAGDSTGRQPRDRNSESSTSTNNRPAGSGGLDRYRNSPKQGTDEPARKQGPDGQQKVTNPEGNSSRDLKSAVAGTRASDGKRDGDPKVSHSAGDKRSPGASEKTAGPPGTDRNDKTGGSEHGGRPPERPPAGGGEQPRDPANAESPGSKQTDFERFIRLGTDLRPDYDERTGEIVSYTRRAGGYWQTVDRNGKFVASGETPIQRPAVDPTDLLVGPGRALVKGAIVMGSRALGRAAAKWAARTAVKRAASSGGRAIGSKGTGTAGKHIGGGGAVPRAGVGGTGKRAGQATGDRSAGRKVAAETGSSTKQTGAAPRRAESRTETASHLRTKRYPADSLRKAVKDGPLKSVQAGRALTTSEKALLRAEARLVVEGTGRVLRKGQHVHHRIPLEHAHRFPGRNPNAPDNLRVLGPKHHVFVHKMWQRWAKELANRGLQPTPERVRRAERAISDHLRWKPLK